MKSTIHGKAQRNLLARYKVEGEAAFEPRSRRPHHSPNTISDQAVERIIELRTTLADQGHDAGAHTIAWHLARENITVSTASIWRTLKRADLITAEPKKKPKSAYIRFEAEQPNETWQSDFTHCRLADRTDTEVITFLDDHARYALSITAYRRIKGTDVVDTFRRTIEENGVPASTLTDNGMVYTVRFATGKGGRTGFETELARLGITQKNSRPNHPTTCGKVERFQQTMKNWLRAQPAPETIAELQHQLDTFRNEYNQDRPHRSLAGRTPAAAYLARPKATPTSNKPDNTHERVRHDIIDDTGKVTLRYNGKLYKIGIGRTHARTPIIMLIQDREIRVVQAITGELLRELTLDPTKKYQPQQKQKDR